MILGDQSKMFAAMNVAGGMDPLGKGSPDQPRDDRGRWTSSGGKGPLKTSGDENEPEWGPGARHSPAKTRAALKEAGISTLSKSWIDATVSREPHGDMHEKLLKAGWDHVHEHTSSDGDVEKIYHHRESNRDLRVNHVEPKTTLIHMYDHSGRKK